MDEVTDNASTATTQLTVNNRHRITKASSLMNEADITLKTRVARYYFYKGGAPNGTGVIYFTKLIRRIWQAAAQDDPYADLFLLRIYNALILTRREIKQQIKHYQEYIQQQTNLNWKLAVCQQPTNIHLYFKLSYGYLAAEVIAEFDQYAHLLISAKNIGILLDAPIRDLLERMGNKIRQFLDLPKAWQATGVTRDDIRQQTEVATKAQTLMGALDEQIMARTMRAPDSPDIIRKPS